MNRNQRKYGLSTRVPKRVEIEIKAAKVKSSGKEELPLKRTSMQNRCCYVTPIHKEFGHTTDTQDSDKRKSPITNTSQSYDTNRQKRERQPLIAASSVEKIENYSQYKNPSIVKPKLTPAYVETSDGCQWQNLEDINEVERCIDRDSCVENKENYSQYKNPNKVKPKLTPAYVETSDGCQWQNLEDINDVDRCIDRETLTFRDGQPTSLHIANVPRVKLIAEKFTKYKKNNIQVRKMDEKIVCVEYDVYDCADDLTPVQVMRAFFSVKPDSVTNGQDTKLTLTKLPSNIKNQFDISPEDLTKHSEKEVEIIDDKLIENHSYLEDLRKILRRKQNYAKRKPETLDLQSLYEIAKKDCLHFDRPGAEELFHNELQEIKDLILKNCKSSVHGIKRHTVRRNGTDIPGEKETNNGVISSSLFAELIKNESCTKI